jgi:transcriptional regulator GlxA family with amidase domain
MTVNLGIILYENVQPIDVIGPWEVFAIWKSILKAPINMYLIAETDNLVHCDSQITLKPHLDFNHCPQLDYLLVPGGRGRVKQVHNDRLIRFIQQQAIHSKYVLSVCTGMFLLEKAGLLKGKSATTYWRALPELKALPVDVIEERIVRSGNVWTSGGISSGIDLALALIETIAGKETAGQVQMLFEFFPNDTMYCSSNTVNTLPVYEGSSATVKPYLPQYIKDHLKLLS